MFWEKIDRLKEDRPKAHVVDVSEMNEEEVLKKLHKLTR